MRLSIENEYLRVSVDTFGAQLRSIEGRDGCQYLWQGDPAYWEDQAPVLFPFIGRLQDTRYQVNGKICSVPIHGFACREEFSPVSQAADALTLAIRGEDKACYPCAFVFEITYRLRGNTLEVQNRVHNPGKEALHFALGGHPGFRVPLEAGEDFEDYYLEFSQACAPDRVGFTDDTVLLNGRTERFSLEDGKILPLRHDLFDNDAIILQNMARQVALKSKKSSRCVLVSYPDMPYLGFWHWPKKPAPYVCIEPWSSLPGRSGVCEEIACRSDFVHLAAGQTYENTWTVQVL